MPVKFANNMKLDTINNRFSTQKDLSGLGHGADSNKLKFSRVTCYILQFGY